MNLEQHCEHAKLRQGTKKAYYCEYKRECELMFFAYDETFCLAEIEPNKYKDENFPPKLEEGK